MNRIVNDPNFVVEDMLKGFVKANKDLVTATDNPRVLKYVNAPVEGKVGIVTGGGSGHKPAFIGYIGKNLCDAVAAGEIFSSPTAKAFLDAMKAADSGKSLKEKFGVSAAQRRKASQSRLSSPMTTVPPPPRRNWKNDAA